MPFTAESNRKMVEKVKELYGVDPQGKSNHHKRAGKLASHASYGYFSKLSETEEGRAKLKEISARGGKSAADQTS